MTKKKILCISVIAAVLCVLIGGICRNVRHKHSDPAYGNTELSDTAVTEKVNTYTVTFYSDDGTVLKIDTVKENMPATPPRDTQFYCRDIFKGWDRDLSCVRSDMDVYPVCESLDKKNNAFVIGSVYGKIGDIVELPVLLCGEVCVSGFDITVYYDHSLLELKKVSEDGGVIYNSDSLGEINMNYVSVENTVGDVDVCNMQFEIKSEGETAVTVKVNSIYAFDGKSDERLIVPEHYVINGNIYILD